jgi:hypothetical protein
MFRKIATCIALTAALASAQPKVADILVSLDTQSKMNDDIKAHVALTQQKTGQGAKKLEMTYYRRDSDQSFLIAMTAPENEKGNGYLRTNDNFWMYRRNTRTFQHINRDEAVGGSDAHGDDFETRNLAELYGAALDKDGKEIIAADKLGEIPVWRFEVKATVKDVDYPKKIYWTRKDNNLILKEQSFSSNGTLMQTGYYRKYTQMGGKYIPIQQIFMDEFEKGNKTVVEISDLVLSRLDGTIFTKAYLENLSK